MITIKAYYISFGCKVNLYETECIKGVLREKGVGIAKSESETDIFIINSCTVTSTGDKKLRQTLHRLKRTYPDVPVVLTGCFPQAFPEKAAEISEADIITGSRNKNDIYPLIEQFMQKKNRVVEIPEIKTNLQIEKMSLDALEKKTRAFVKIQDGCNQFCTYCIIPKARGRICSKPIDELIMEVSGLAEKGYKEVVLVGINLSFYGKEFGLRLVDAIEAVCGINGIERVRLGSIEPEVISDEDIERMKAQKKLCPQFHLSLQSGCDRTLKAMNRHYTSEEYLTIVEKLRVAFEDCSITTDIMVGFPDETDEDFEKSCEFIRKVCFNQSHIFPYSRREGTPAYNMKNQVPDKIKTKRAEIMAEIASDCQARMLETQVGKVFPVLFERDASPEFHNGHAPNFTFIKVPKKNCEKSLRNSILYVKIDRIEKDYCIGQIIE